MSAELKFSEEQEAILSSIGNLKIEAIAGSGKTTIKLEYARRNSHKQGIYLSYNKKNAGDIQEKAFQNGINNLKASTFHSLAYKDIFGKRLVKITNSLSYFSVSDYLRKEIEVKDHEQFRLLVAAVIKFTNAYLNSSHRDISNFGYEIEGYDQSLLQHLGGLVWYGMISGDLPIIHDFYLKQFQLKKPLLNYDFILVDEFQDATDVFVDVVLNQDRTVIAMGDMHQQIYKWRGAGDNFDNLPFQKLKLTNSYRFGQSICDFALSILKGKYKLGLYDEDLPPAKGLGGKQGKGYAYVSRTNVQLLQGAIRFLNDNPGLTMYFNGGLNKILSHDYGMTIYDIINLYNENYNGIKSPFIRDFDSIEELSLYANQVEDRILVGFIKLVDTFGNDLSNEINRIEEATLDVEENSDNADAIFTSAHAAKGFEYKTVFLEDDFLNLADLERLLITSKDPNKVIEEVNILYVAATRAQVELDLPDRIRMGF